MPSIQTTISMPRAMELAQQIPLQHGVAELTFAAEGILPYDESRFSHINEYLKLCGERRILTFSGYKVIILNRNHRRIEDAELNIPIGFHSLEQKMGIRESEKSQFDMHMIPHLLRPGRFNFATYHLHEQEAMAEFREHDWKLLDQEGYRLVKGEILYKQQHAGILLLRKQEGRMGLEFHPSEGSEPYIHDWLEQFIRGNA